MRSALDKITTQTLRYIPLILGILTPLFFLLFTSDFFNLNKFYLITALASLSLVAWCFRNIARGKISLTLSPAFFPLLILVLVVLVSSLWLSPIKHLSLFGQTSLILSLIIIFFTTTSSQKNHLTVKSLIFGLIASGSLLSLFTILHHFGLIDQIFKSTLSQNKFFNLTGGILPALTFTIPVLIATLAYAISAKSWLSKSSLFFFSVLMMLASIINISLLLPQNGQPVLLLLPYSASWSIAVDVLKNWQTALFGTGPETFFSTFTRFRPAYLNLDKNLWNLRFSESGSTIMTFLATIGLLGTLAFLSAFIAPLFAAFKLKDKVEEHDTFLFLLVGLVATILSFIFLPTGLLSLTLIFLLLIGLTIEIKLASHEKYTKDVSLTPSAIFVPWTIALLSLVLLAFYWFYAVSSYAASAAIKQAGDVNRDNPSASFLKQVSAAKLDPYNPSYPLILSQTYQGVARYYLSKQNPTADDKKNAVDSMQGAVDYGRTAASLSPVDVNVYENLANIYQSFIGSANGSSDYAVAHYAQAIGLDPTNPRLRLQLGILFFNLGDSDQAFKVISQAISLKPDWDLPYYNTAAIYKSKKDYATALQYMRTGFQYTDPQSSNLPSIQAEITALEKLTAPAPVAIPSPKTTKTK